MSHRKGYGMHMGHEKEPPSRFGPRESGRPPVHSHSARPKRKILVKHGSRKRMA